MLLGLKRDILDTIKKKQLNWFGHVIKRGDDSYIAYKEQFNGKRPQGGPPKRWADQVRQEMQIPLLTAERNAKIVIAGKK